MDVFNFATGQGPVVTAPSGTYGFIVPMPMEWEGDWPSVQVVQAFGNGHYGGTPARYRADTIANHEALTLAIDYGQGWYLSPEDTAAFVKFAQRVMRDFDADNMAEAEGILGPIRKTPEMWAVEHEVYIMDADGWRRSSPLGEKDFDEPITEAEFLERLQICTQGPRRPAQSNPELWV